MSTNLTAMNWPVDHRLSRRRFRNFVMTALLALTTAAAIAILVWVLGYIAVQGLQFLGPEFLTQNPPGSPAAAGGGFFNGIIGSLIVVGIASAIAIPFGVAVAVYLAELGRGRLAGAVRFFANVLMGIPTIVTGAFVYAIWVVRFGFSGFAGSLALAIVMIPLIIRTTEEMLRLVPTEVREAAYALGATPFQAVRKAVIPFALPGIVTGIMLAVARAMGETAPLLLTALGNDLFTETNPGHRMSTLSLQIFDNAVTGFRASQARAWAGALTLVLIVVGLFAIARLLSARARTKE
jgi:phosphate transport system permease protein